MTVIPYDYLDRAPRDMGAVKKARADISNPNYDRLILPAEPRNYRSGAEGAERQEQDLPDTNGDI